MGMESKEKPKEKPKKKTGKGVVLKLLLLCAVLYLAVNSILGMTGASYSSYNVQNGYLEEYVTADGYIFREQTVIPAPSDGILECETEEEERVSQGEVVASVYQSEIDTAANEQLRKITAEIKRLEKNTLQKDVYANDTARLEQQIAGETKSLTSLSYRHQWEEISELKEEINRLIDKKRTANGEKESDEVILEQLRAQKAELEQTNQVERVSLTAPCPGVFTSRIDGMEEALSVDKLDDLNVQYLKELDKQDISLREEVTAGKAACKIVNNSEWYFAARVPTDDAKLFSEGEDVSLRFFDRSDEAISAEVADIIEGAEGESVLLVRSNGYVESIYSTSKTNAAVIKQRYTGFKLPTQCVRVKGGVKGVYVLRGDVAKFVPVNLLYNNSEWAVVRAAKTEGTGLKLYDEAIVKAEGLEDGTKLR